MSAIQVRVITAGLFFLFIFLSGYWLSSLGKPINGMLLTIHKFIALAVVVFLVITIVRINKETSLSGTELIVSVLTIVFFLVTIVTGGLVSTDLKLPMIVRRAHQIGPYLTLLSTAATLYLLLG